MAEGEIHKEESREDEPPTEKELELPAPKSAGLLPQAPRKEEATPPPAPSVSPTPPTPPPSQAEPQPAPKPPTTAPPQPPPAQVEPPQPKPPEPEPEQKEEVVQFEEPEAPPASAHVRPLRTFRGDVEQSIEKRKTSLLGISIAEMGRKQKRGGEPREEKKPVSRKSIAIVAGSMALILGGGALMWIFYSATVREPVTPATLAPSLINVEETSTFNMTGLSRANLLNRLSFEKEAVALSLGNIERIVLTQNAGEGEVLVSAPAFLEAINAHAAASFLRTLDPAFALGVHVFDGNQPFLIFKTNFYENAFAGMLAWEPFLHDDLAPLFGEALGRQPSGEEATTTTADLIPPAFADRVVRNKDTRVLSDKNGKGILLYSFVDRNTLIITTNEHTFAEVFTRLSGTRVVR